MDNINKNIAIRDQYELELEDIVKKVVQQRQECVESKLEIAKALYQYLGPTVVNNGCVLRHGDYMYQKGDMLKSARNVEVYMPAGDLMEHINEGSLTRIFNPDDLNSPDVGLKIDDILGEMGKQAKYKDGFSYFIGNAADTACAMFVDMADPNKKLDFVLEIIEGKPKVRTPQEALLHVDMMRECTYEEFNPGGREIQLQVDKINNERENKTSAYERLKKEYEANGANKVKEPGEILKDGNLSSKEKMQAYTRSKELSDMDDGQSESNYFDDMMMPKSMRRTL